MSYPNILIDITTTATHRPDILFRTIDSFTERMLTPVIDKCRLIINVDPVGDETTTRQILSIIQLFFKYYHVRFTKQPSFPKAFIWCWSQVIAPWVLNIEEDWELLVKTDVLSMIKIMEEEPDLAILRLPFKPSRKTQKNWSTHYPWTGKYYECPAGKRLEMGFCGHPSLIRSDFVHGTVPWLDDTKNPEKQFHHGEPMLMREILKYRYGCWGKDGEDAYVRDIGREWMAKNGWAKKGSKAFFTEWEKVE